MLEVNYRGRTLTIDDSERQPCEIWDRIMGYLRPITMDAFKTTQWNYGKVSEWRDREHHRYNETKSMRVLPDYESITIRGSTDYGEVQEETEKVA